MDDDEDSQATQQATQNALDPRRLGQQNSGFSDEDISDIICVLHPNSEAASREIHRIAASAEYSRHTAGRYSVDAIQSDLYREDDAREFGRTRGIGDHALVLRLSSPVKDPRLGFTFGRNASRCDICFTNDPARRLSNIHFRIYVNRHGSVLLEDQSTNGTVVDSHLLKKRPDPRDQRLRRTLESGSKIEILMHESSCDLTFLVRIPRRDGKHEDAYLRNLAAYMQRASGEEEDVNKTIGPGPSGHVNLFAPTKVDGLRNPVAEKPPALQTTFGRLPREWRGGDKYARVGVIGKGAFATVHKVTSKYDGSPYAAKELDKRKFMKNGVLDQKVENEMKIMQKVHHAHIVQYIEHFDWDVHQFIIIMEFVPGGDLGKFISEHGAIAEPHVKTIAEQLVDAVGYLHDNKITHRDVKPDNILIRSANPLVVKLTDFGLSKMIDTEQTFLKTFCGTLLYCAPEVYTEYSSYDDHGQRTQRRSRQPVDRERYDHAVDIWSLGGVLFYTLTSSPPFPVKNGITYTELLDHIIKTPLNTRPLEHYEISKVGIQFLSRMIHVRPETRATVSELKSHVWLKHPSESIDQLSYDEDLGQSASQLSLNDRQLSEVPVNGTSSLGEPEPDFSMQFESEKENHTFEQPPGLRLFGEVSAIGSSGVIPEDRLNLPISSSSFGNRDPLEYEVRDSFDDSDDFSTPRENISADPNSLSEIQIPSQEDNSRSVLFGIGSQSLGGASSILGNLTMKSTPAGDADTSYSRISNLGASKRKPVFDTSDEHDAPSRNPKPSIKRLKSKGGVDDEEDEGDEHDHRLWADMPQMIKSDTGRQIDYPLPKTTFWDGSDRKTWHLNYPEMTHLQYNAFETAAENRKEEFVPGTLLWDFAMKHFPPTMNSSNSDSRRPRETTSSNLTAIQQPHTQPSEWNVPPTAPIDQLDPSTLQLENEQHRNQTFPLSRTVPQTRTEVGVFTSATGSLVPGISISLRDPLLSWGRERSNTVVYELAMESKVPKNAFRIMMWREGYNGSVNEFRPWEPARSSRTARASPEPDSYGFYIATKATNGIRINGNPLQAHDPKDGTGVCKYWMKLYHGDQIVFWGGEDPCQQAKLVFECSWGGSSGPRPSDEPPTCVPTAVAQKLDRLWPRLTTTFQYLQIKTDAQMEQEIRLRNMSQEEERSRVFEQKRLEVMRRSRGSSPDSSRSTVRVGLPRLPSPPSNRSRYEW
ncbi:Pkinase-domain-containing protein [Xylariaceae sp. FL1272]|nr:Pkinase-domain-containing protein [Xylariaceae sp. FL1272]